MAQNPQAQPASRQQPVAAEVMADPKYGAAARIVALPAAKLAALLRDPDASVYARAKACQRLAVAGGPAAVPALAPLLSNPELSHYARIALETMPAGAADDALRAALAKTQGRLLAGVVTSIGMRRDSKAFETLEKLRHSGDAEVASAANAALARIRPVL